MKCTLLNRSDRLASVAWPAGTHDSSVNLCFELPKNWDTTDISWQLLIRRQSMLVQNWGKTLDGSTWKLLDLSCSAFISSKALCDCTRGSLVSPFSYPRFCSQCREIFDWLQFIHVTNIFYFYLIFSLSHIF